LPKSILVHFIL